MTVYELTVNGETIKFDDRGEPHLAHLLDVIAISLKGRELYCRPPRTTVSVGAVTLRIFDVPS